MVLLRGRMKQYQYLRSRSNGLVATMEWLKFWTTPKRILRKIELKFFISNNSCRTRKTEIKRNNEVKHLSNCSTKIKREASSSGERGWLKSNRNTGTLVVSSRKFIVSLFVSEVEPSMLFGSNHRRTTFVTT